MSNTIVYRKFGKDVEDFGTHWLIDERYIIYKDDGCVYDTIAAKDIPAEVFKLRDELLKKGI